MEHNLQLSMPIDGNEKDWMEYIGAIRSASRLSWTSGRNQAERLQIGWQVHRTAMKMLNTEIWRKYPLLKKTAWDVVKETLAFMDQTMGCGENISDQDRMIWRREYEECFFALPWTKKNVYGFSCSSRLYDCKRQAETLVTTEVLVKKSKETGLVSSDEREKEQVEEIDLTGEQSEQHSLDRKAIDMIESNFEEFDLTGERNEQQSLDRKAINMLFEDSDDNDGEDDLVDGRRVECWTGDRVDLNETVNVEEEEENNKGYRFETGFEVSEQDVCERFLVKHNFKSEEDLFNGLACGGRVVNMVRADGGELGDIIPKVVMVVMENVNFNILDMADMVIKRLGSWNPGQRWKMLQDGFRNVTEDLSETCQRWDIGGDVDVLNQLYHDMKLEVKLKPVFENHFYYEKVIWRNFVGKKLGSCCGESGALCLSDVAGVETFMVPGRQETSNTYAKRKCFPLDAVEWIGL